MIPLPVITGFGGFNAAGRSSFHQSYLRTIIDSIDIQSRRSTLMGLGTLMGELTYSHGTFRNKMGSPVDIHSMSQSFDKHICDNTLIRKIHLDHFDVDRVRQNIGASLIPHDGKIEFIIDAKKLPNPLPFYWSCQPLEGNRVKVTLSQPLNAYLPSHYQFPVQAAGILPTGINPANHYNSRFHPRGLQLALLGASDAVNSLGIPWESIADTLSPDAIGVYASSIMSQMDENSFAGLLQSRLLGKRVSTKQLVMGFNSMPADFVNAYVLGNLGITGSMTGACASFLYNLRLAVKDIQNKRRQLVIVGCSEAPVTPEIMEGYATMGALASDEKLSKLDGINSPDHRKASRPFGENCGFTIGESSQYVVLMSDELAVSMGANIYGSVHDVFVHADGYKKSISAPGPGNYITFAKAVAATNQIIGEKALREETFVQAHGSSTPQNRVTESAIFDGVAKAFNIENWPVTATKAFVGHSLSAASGDQLASTLGVFAHQWLPGIKTVDRIASDVHDERLAIATSDQKINAKAAFLNSKGFGGNNATACVLSPEFTREMIAKRTGKKAMLAYEKKREHVSEAASEYNNSALQGNLKVKYHFGENLVDESGIRINDKTISIPGQKHNIALPASNRYKDMSE